MIYPVRTMPRDIPRKVLMDSWDRPQAAIVYPLGTDDAQKLIVDTACWLYRAGKIDRVLIVAGIETNNWHSVIGTNLADDIELYLSFFPDKPRDTSLQEVGKEPLQFRLIYGHETFQAAASIETFLFKGRSMLVVDSCNEFFTEPMSEQSMALQQISHHAAYRRILMGRLPKLPHHAWSPYKILSGDGPHLLGYPSALAMRMRYYKNEEVKDYPAFVERVKSAPTYFLDKEEMQDLPGPIKRQYHAGALRSVLKETPGKIVIFHHLPKREEMELIRWVGDQIHEHGDNIPGEVLAVPEWIRPELTCPERRAFFTDPKVQVLIVPAHAQAGRLDVAHASIYMDHCPKFDECHRACERQVEWNERRHKVTHFRINPS